MTKADENRQSLEQLHTHIILPGTAPSVVDRIPVYNNASKGHDALFRELASQNFEAALDQTLGRNWRRTHEANADFGHLLEHEDDPVFPEL